jgi:hypothetical protein
MDGPVIGRAPERRPPGRGSVAAVLRRFPGELVSFSGTSASADELEALARCCKPETPTPSHDPCLDGSRCALAALCNGLYQGVLLTSRSRSLSSISVGPTPPPVRPSWRLAIVTSL